MFPSDKNQPENSDSGLKSRNERIHGFVEGTLEMMQKKEYVLVGKTRVKSWHAWLLIGIAAGIATGAILVVSERVEFVPVSAEHFSTRSGIEHFGVRTLELKTAELFQEAGVYQDGILVFEEIMKGETDTAVSPSASPVSAPLPERLLIIARERKRMFLSLIKNNPEFALRAALPKDLRIALPAIIQDELEKEMDETGELEVMHADDFVRGAADYFYTLKSSQRGKFLLHFAGSPPSLVSGTIVRVRGVMLEDHVAISAAPSVGLEVISLPRVLSLTTKKLALVLFNFQNNPVTPWTLDQVRAITFTNANSPNSYYQEVSFGRTGLVGKLRQDGDVFGWYTIPYNSTDPCAYNIWTQAARNAAIAAGVDFGGYTNIQYISNGSSCQYGGLATLGGSWSWINGGPDAVIQTHELGHNFGAWHSHSLTCKNPAGQYISFGTPVECKGSEYGDPFDVMGLSMRHMNNFQKGLVDGGSWYDPSNVVNVVQDGTYTLEPLGPPSLGPKALKVALPGFPVYYIEYRQPYGTFDNFSNTSAVVGGISMRVVPPTSYSYPCFGGNVQVCKGPMLLDLVPDGNFGRSALAPGKTFMDSLNGLAVTLVAKTATAATVDISLSSKCVRANPSISITPLSQWGNAGSALSYTITVTNNDGLLCGPSAFTLVPVFPGTGWTHDPSTANLSIDPQASHTTSVTLTSPLGAASGFYTFTETVSNPSGGYSSSASANYNIFDTIPPSVSITKPQKNALVRGTVIVEALASDNVGVSIVEFYKDADRVPYATITSAPYVVSLDTRMLMNASHILKVKAFDAAGNTKTAMSRIAVDNLAPRVTLTKPTNGVTVSGSVVSLVATASDNKAVERVEFYYDADIFIGSSRRATYTTIWDSTKVANGTHTLFAKAIDRAGNVATSTSVVVTVRN